MTCCDLLTVEGVLAAFDEHLRRTRGVCPGTRVNYARFVRAFLQTVSADGLVDVGEVQARDVVEFVGGGLSRRYQPRTVELAASSLRSFFRFLRAEGLHEGRLQDAVPMVPHRRTGLVRHLDPSRFEQLIASLDSSSPRDAQRHGDQGVHEVAQRGLHDLAAVHAVDVDTPVDAHDQRGDGQERESARAEAAHTAESAEQRQQGDDDDERPDDPVAEDLDGTRGLEQRPVEGEQPPQQVGARSVGGPAAQLGHARTVRRQRLRARSGRHGDG